MKDERNYAGFIQQISRGMNASPGFFIIASPNDNGDVAVYAPVEGRPLDGCRVGSVNKAGVKAAKELTEDGPVYVPGIVWFRSTTPQIELAHWFG